jgi:hypothetical protein
VKKKDDRIIPSWLWDGKLFIRATVQQGAAAQLYSKKEERRESLLLSHGKRCHPPTHVLIFLNMQSIESLAINMD